eukprot:420241_1
MKLISFLSSYPAITSSLFIETNGYHNCVLEDKNVKCWGMNMFGQLGNGDTNNIGDESNEMGDNLREIDLGTGFTPMQVMLGGYHTCALSTTKKAKCWGSNTKGELGYGHTNHTGDQPNEMGDNLLEIDLGSGFIPIEITAGSDHTCSLSIFKTKCWGYNFYGQLGYGDTNDRGSGANQMGDNLPEIDLGSNFIPMQIMTGYTHTCALSTNNKVKCFGMNTYGQLGKGDTNHRGDDANEMGDNLLEIDLGTGFMPIQIVAGDCHTCALSTTNKVKCFGRNNWAQLGYDDKNNRGDGPNEMGDNLLVIDLGSNFNT